MIQENPKYCRKKNRLQCYLTIPKLVTFIYDNRIDLNENKDVFNGLNQFLASDYWLPYEHINDEVMKKVENTKGQLAGDEMEK